MIIIEEAGDISPQQWEKFRLAERLAALVSDLRDIDGKILGAGMGVPHSAWLEMADSVLDWLKQAKA